MPPFNDFKNIFNFYYSSDIIECTGPPFGFDAVGGNVACPDWEKPLNSCGIEHDIAVVFVNACLDNIQTFYRYFYDYSLSGMMSIVLFSEQSSPVALHEIGHWFGLYEEYMVGNIMGPNNFYGLDSCGKPLCRITKGPTPGADYYEETKSTEVRGGTCCYQLHYNWGGYSPIYVTNEKSIMKANQDDRKKGFSLTGEQYIKEALRKISNIGVEAWLPQKAKWEVFSRDSQVPTVSVTVPSSAKVNEEVNITVTGNDDTAIQSLHVLNFGDATFLDYTCGGAQKICTHVFTHTYSSLGTYYIRVQAKDSFGQGSTHKDSSGITITY